MVLAGASGVTPGAAMAHHPAGNRAGTARRGGADVSGGAGVLGRLGSSAESFGRATRCTPIVREAKN